MDPLIGGALIGGGAALIGGFLGNKQNKKIAREQMALQREFAQHGLSWRVEDAKAAGLHPLSALGAQLPAYSPVGFQDSIGPALSEAGQNVGRAVSAQMTSSQRQLQQLALAQAQKGLEETDARIALLRSEEFRNMQEANSAKTFPVADDWSVSTFGNQLPQSYVPEVKDLSGMVNPKAPDLIYHTAGDVSTMAGETPLWRRFVVAPGVSLKLPGGVSGDAAEVLESLAESPLMMAAVMAENSKNPAAVKWMNDMFGVKGEPLWRVPGAWLGGKLADWTEKLQGLGGPKLPAKGRYR